MKNELTKLEKRYETVKQALLKNHAAEGNSPKTEKLRAKLAEIGRGIAGCLS